MNRNSPANLQHRLILNINFVSAMATRLFCIFTLLAFVCGCASTSIVEKQALAGRLPDGEGATIVLVPPGVSYLDYVNHDTSSAILLRNNQSEGARKLYIELIEATQTALKKNNYKLCTSTPDMENILNNLSWFSDDLFRVFKDDSLKQQLTDFALKYKIKYLMVVSGHVDVEKVDSLCGIELCGLESFGIPDSNNTDIRVGLIDLNTATVVWTNRCVVHKNIEQWPKVRFLLFQSLFP